MISNSLRAPYSNRGKEQLQNIKTWTNWQSRCVANIDGKLSKSVQVFSISDHGVDLPEPTAISKSRQRPKRNSSARHLHTRPMNLKFWCFLSSWLSCGPHKSHLRRGGRTWYPDSNWNCTGDNIGRIELHNEHNCIPERITIPSTINPAQLLIK